jgi:hypothetical protein
MGTRLLRQVIRATELRGSAGARPMAATPDGIAGQEKRDVNDTQARNQAERIPTMTDIALDNVPTFVKIPRELFLAVLNGAISKEAAYVWCIVRLYAWRDQQPGAFSPARVEVPNRELGQWLGGMHRTQIYRYLKELQAAGLLDKSATPRKRWLQLLLPDVAPAHRSTGETVHPGNVSPTQRSTHSTFHEEEEGSHDLPTSTPDRPLPPPLAVEGGAGGDGQRSVDATVHPGNVSPTQRSTDATSQPGNVSPRERSTDATFHPDNVSPKERSPHATVHGGNGAGEERSVDATSSGDNGARGNGRVDVERTIFEMLRGYRVFPGPAGEIAAAMHAQDWSPAEARDVFLQVLRDVEGNLGRAVRRLQNGDWDVGTGQRALAEAERAAAQRRNQAVDLDAASDGPLLRRTPPPPLPFAARLDDLDARELWTAALNDLALQMTRATFDMWLRGTPTLGFDADTLVVQVKNRAAQEWLESRLAPVIDRTLTRLAGRPLPIRYVDVPPARESLPVDTLERLNV